MIKDLLEKIGLSETETEVYLSVLEQGKALPSRISKQTNIKRPTVYAAAEELVKKGILEKDLSGKSTYYIASSPNTIENYVEQEKRAVLDKMKAAKDIVGELETIHRSKRYSIPKIQFVDGEDVEQFLYKQGLVWSEKMNTSNETTWWGFQDHTFVEDKKNRDWIDWYWKNVPDSINLKLFTNDEGAEREIMSKKNTPRRYIKYWEGDPFTTSQWIVGDYVVNLVTNQKPYYLIQIHDKLLAENLRNLYKKLWEDNK